MRKCLQLEGIKLISSSLTAVVCSSQACRVEARDHVSTANKFCCCTVKEVYLYPVDMFMEPLKAQHILTYYCKLQKLCTAATSPDSLSSNKRKSTTVTDSVEESALYFVNDIPTKIPIKLQS